MRIVGRRLIDFTNKEGEQIKGVKLFLLDLDDNVEGEIAGERFFSFGSNLYHIASTIEVPCEADFVFRTNMSGKSTLIDIVPFERG